MMKYDNAGHGVSVQYALSVVCVIEVTVHALQTRKRKTHKRSLQYIMTSASGDTRGLLEKEGEPWEGVWGVGIQLMQVAK